MRFLRMPCSPGLGPIRLLLAHGMLSPVSAEGSISLSIYFWKCMFSQWVLQCAMAWHQNLKIKINGWLSLEGADLYHHMEQVRSCPVYSGLPLLLSPPTLLSLPIPLTLVQRILLLILPRPFCISPTSLVYRWPFIFVLENKLCC